MKQRLLRRYRRQESSVEEALMEMCLAGVSVRRVEDITEVLWGCKVSSSTISELNKEGIRTHRTVEKPDHLRAEERSPMCMWMAFI